MSLNPLVWKDPQAWGIVLADLAGHVANAYKQALGLNRGETMRKITELLVAELTNPTDSACGQMQNTRPRHSPKIKKSKHLWSFPAACTKK